MQPVLGPTYVVNSDSLPEISRDQAFAPPPPELLHQLLQLETDEHILQATILAETGTAVALTSRALYVLAPPVGGKMGKLIDSVFSSMPRAPPKLRQGYQVWRSAAANAVITRVGLDIIEALSVRKQQGAEPCALCCSVPRSAVPHAEHHFPSRPATTKESAKSTGAPRAALLFALGDECRVWLVVVRQLVRTRWQRLLEASCIAEPEVYQLHARAKLLPLSRGGGAPLSRMLVLSDRRVYSIKRDGMSLRGAGEWRADIDAIGSIEQHLDLTPPRDRLPLPPSYPYGVSLHWLTDGTSDAAFFAVKSTDEAAAVVAALRYAHLEVTGRPLKLVVHGASHAG